MSKRVKGPSTDEPRKAGPPWMRWGILDPEGTLCFPLAWSEDSAWQMFEVHRATAEHKGYRAVPLLINLKGATP